MSITRTEHIQAASQLEECHLLNLLNLDQKKLANYKSTYVAVPDLAILRRNMTF